MPLWVIWLIASGVMLILEIFTVSFFLFFPGIAAFIAFICAILGLPLEVQVIVFISCTILMIAFIRPLITKFFKTKDVQMNSKSVIGKNAIVLRPIDNINKTGQVKVSGEVWSAISSDDEPIEVDTMVIVESIDGVKLVVRKV